MLRHSATLSAVALVLALAACGWPDSSNDPTPTPSSHGSAGGGDSGSEGDANTDGDTIVDGTGGSAGDGGTTSNAFTNLTGSQDFSFSTASDLGLGRKAAVAEDGTVSLLMSDNTVYLAIGPNDVVATEDGVSRFANAAQRVEGEVSVPGEGLDYTAYGYWIVRDAGGGSGTVKDGGAIYGGTRTGLNALAALSGTASYAGKALGVEYAWDAAAKTGEIVTTLQGTMAATVDFDAMTVAATLDMQDAQGAEWGRLTFGNVDFRDSNGNLSSNFTGGITSNQGHKSGFVSGHFHGPDAGEIGGRFGVGAGQGTATTQVRGSFGAVRR